MKRENDNERDVALLASMAGGDHAALKALYGRHSVRIFRFIMRSVNDRDTAEELMNEVFLEGWRNAGRFEGRSTVSTWLLAIAGNKAATHLRRRRNEDPLDEATIATTPDPGIGPETATGKADEARAMRDCLAALSPDHRAVVELTYYQERSIEEAAEILAIPVNTVKTRMFYARRRLAELLRKRGIVDA
jgi:RNA polymerase sigma-70 factor (ECF subfamily)